MPVIGQARWRLAPDFAVRDQSKEAFAPGFDMAEGFDNEDQPVDDFRAMTYTSYDSGPRRDRRLHDGELPLDERFKQTPVPLMVIFGAEDQIFDAEAPIEGYAGRPRRQDAS